VDYDLLLANVTLLDSFKLACAGAVAAQAGRGISASDVHVTVYDGSVIVEATIAVPENVSVVTVADNVGAFDSLADAVAQAVQPVPGIASVQTGVIGVIQVTTTTTTTFASVSLPGQVDDANVASTLLVFGVIAGIICAGACGGIIVWVNRRGRGEPKPGEIQNFFQVAPVEATPVEIFQNSPRDTIHSVKQKLDDGADDSDDAAGNVLHEPKQQGHPFPQEFAPGRVNDWLSSVEDVSDPLAASSSVLPALPQVTSRRSDGLGVVRRRSLNAGQAWS